MEGQITRRGVLGTGAVGLAGTTLGTVLPVSAWAAHPNVTTFLEIVDRGLNHGDLRVIDENVSPAMVEHQFYGLNWPPGREGIKALVIVLRTAFPDLHCDVQDVAVEGDKVFGRAVTTGTFTGNYLGVPGNGNKIEIAIMDEFRFEHKKVVEHWGVADNLVLLLQLGLIPAGSLPSYHSQR